MDKIKKFLKKLSVFEREEVSDILYKIESKDIENLDIKKLKGYKDLFRVRKGDIRIIFCQDDKNINVLFIGRRGDSKYKQF